MKPRYFILDKRQNTRSGIKDYYYVLLKITHNDSDNKEEYPYRGDFFAYNRSKNHSKPWKKYKSKSSSYSVFKHGDSNIEFSLEWYLHRNNMKEVGLPQ